MTPIMSRKAGFTLLELLVGAVISAVLLAALGGVFYGMQRAQARAYANLEEAAPRAQVVALMKNDIANMTLAKGVLCGPVLGQTQGAGLQRTDYLSFYSSTGKVGDVNPWGDVQKVEYLFSAVSGQGGNAQGQLMRMITRNLLATNLNTGESEFDIYDQYQITALLDGVGSLTLQYFDGQTWYDYWDSSAQSNALPKAVRARIEFAANDDSTVATTPATAPIEFICEVASQSPADRAASGS